MIDCLTVGGRGCARTWMVTASCNLAVLLKHLSATILQSAPRSPSHSARVGISTTTLRTPTNPAYPVVMTDLAIDDATLNAAERLFGVRYTDAEHAQMRDNLAQQVELAIRRRAVKLPNTLPPATLFDPRLPGFAMAGKSCGSRNSRLPRDRE